MVVGDIMMHSPVVNSAYDDRTGQYNFDKMFVDVAPVFAQADLLIGNLETPLAGDHIAFSGYPQFNGPLSLARTLKEVGFDILTTANNHVLDQYEAGLVNTLDVLDDYGIHHTGSSRTLEEQETALIVEVSGIRIGIISYTYGTNGIPLPKGKPYMVNLLDMEKISAEVDRLQAAQADYIVAMIHYGIEYDRLASREQKRWTEQILDSGVDFVLGSHPHVVQPIELKADGKGVIYSLGNFLSNQRDEWKDYGVILDLHLKKDFSTGETILTKVDAIPTYVERTRGVGRNEYLIQPLNVDTDQLSRTVWQNGQALMKHMFGEEGKVAIEQATK